MLAAALLGLPVAAFAQASGIAGIVRDTSGAVMPGVTVEVASPALIEKVRTATTDGQGRYNIVDLRPGVYAVTFTLVGFSTVRREGVELPAQFTATVNADLRVGALEETITVSGDAPVVDTTNVVRRQVVDDETINAMPTSKNWSTIGIMTIGVFSNQNDVGGSAGEHQNQLKAHGGSFNDRLVQMDGLMIANMACNYSCTGLSTNDASTQELSYEIGAISAETGGGGVRVNIIPKEGGNVFSGSVFANFANSGLQSDNLDQDLIDQGVLSVDSLDQIYDTNFALGGPIMKDKLWFWTAHRFWGYEIFRTGAFYDRNSADFVYDPDPARPATDSQTNTSDDLRLTWQMSPKNKLSLYYNLAPRDTNFWNLSNVRTPDSAQLQNVKLNHFETVSFKSTLSSKLLLDLAGGNMSETWTREPIDPSESPTAATEYAVTEQLTGQTFRSYPFTFSRNYTSVRSYRGSLSYVPGSHAFKFGFTLVEGPAETDVYTNHDTHVIVRGGQPIAVTVRTTPYTTKERLVADMGLYAQDTWSVKRFTVNAGLRWDYLNNKVEAQEAGGGTWIGPRSFDEINDVPNYKDIAPRLGVVYDLFGNGKTALKATVSRYVATSTVGFARLVNPFNTTVNQANRNWFDVDLVPGTSTPSGTPKPTDRDGVPQVSEMGPLSSTFGTQIVSTTYDPDVVTGWGKRRNNWEYSASVTHELMNRVSADFSYFYRTQGNFTITDNQETTNADYDEYCVTAPADDRLPNGGGYKVCGFYDLNPAKALPQFADDQVVTFADNYGKQTETFHGFDFILNARPQSGLILNGGFSTGVDLENNCDMSVVDNPQSSTTTTFRPSIWCDRSSGWQTAVKASMSYTFPWQDINFGAVFQNLPGQGIGALWTITAANAEWVRPGRTGFSATSTRTVNIIEPGSEYGDRRSQLDLRFAKNFRMGGTKRVQVMMDIYNAFNSNAPVGATSQAGETPPALNPTYSPPGPNSQWLRPLNILQARYFKFGAQFNF
jgi:hypothetical protein